MADPVLKTLPDGGYETVQVGDVVLPLVEYEDGTTKPLDFPKLIKTVKRVQDEKTKIVTERDDAKKGFESILAHLPEDVREDDNGRQEWFRSALKSMETVASLDAGDLSTAEQLERAKTGVAKNYEEKVRNLETRNKDLLTAKEQVEKDLSGRISSMRRSHAFATSTFVRDRLRIPVDVAEAYFSPHFVDEGGKLVGKFQNGEKIYSRDNPTEDANFDDALGQLVERHPDKSRLLAGTGGDGVGVPASSARTGATGDKNTITREELRKLPQAKQRELMVEKGFTIAPSR